MTYDITDLHRNRTILEGLNLTELKTTVSRLKRPSEHQISAWDTSLVNDYGAPELIDQVNAQEFLDDPSYAVNEGWV